jgi:Tol biopolymer transport system component
LLSGINGGDMSIKGSPLLIVTIRTAAVLIAVFVFVTFGDIAISHVLGGETLVTATQSLYANGWAYSSIELIDINRRVIGQIFADAPSFAFLPSPNRRLVAYPVMDGDSQRCAVRELAGLATVMFTSEPAQTCTPVWAGDSRRVVFIGNLGETWALTMFDVEQGESRTYTADPLVNRWFAQPSPNGERIAFMVEENYMWHVSLLDLNSGEFAPVATPGPLRDEAISDWRCHWSPDGRWFVLPSLCANYDYLWILDTQTGTRQQFDGPWRGISYALPNWSPDGSKLILAVTAESPDESPPKIRLEMITLASGGRTPLLPYAYPQWEVRWSPGSRYVALTGMEDPNVYELLLLDTITGDWTTLDEDSSFPVRPVWSPDERFVLFAGEHHNITTYHLLNLESGDVRQLLHSSDHQLGMDWSPDSAFLYLASGQMAGRGRVHVLDMQSGILRPSAAPLQWFSVGHWAPDGRRLVFTAYAPGRDNNYIVNLEDLSVTHLANHPGYEYIQAWSQDGERYIFRYRDNDNRETIYLTDLTRAETYRLPDSIGGYFRL